MANLPMPGQRFLSGVVIASSWIVDKPADDEAVTGMVMLLSDEPPYYSVVDILSYTYLTGWSPQSRTTFENIVPATMYYQRESGCY